MNWNNPMKMMKRTMTTALSAAMLTGALFGASAAQASSMCVYDPAGKSGDFFAMMTKFGTEASAWGVDLEMKVYTDEETAAKDYEAGQCDGVVATGVRLQRFNNFPSTIEAVGGLQSYDVLKQMITTLATSDGAGKKLAKGGNMTVGFIPVGAVYLFVRDRNIDTVPELAGKRIATLAYDKASIFMVDRVGAIMVPADLGSIGPKFNNGDVDACYVSATGYRPFELFRGLGDKGGIIRAPLAQATLQVMIRTDKFPADFPKKAKMAFGRHFDKAASFVKKAEADIDAKYWVEVPNDTKAEWDQMFQGVRVSLRDKGIYDGTMLSVMKKLRCSKDGSRAECAENKE